MLRYSDGVGRDSSVVERGVVVLLFGGESNGKKFGNCGYLVWRMCHEHTHTCHMWCCHLWDVHALTWHADTVDVSYMMPWLILYLHGWAILTQHIPWSEGYMIHWEGIVRGGSWREWEGYKKGIIAIADHLSCVLCCLLSFPCHYILHFAWHHTYSSIGNRRGFCIRHDNGSIYRRVWIIPHVYL